MSNWYNMRLRPSRTRLGCDRLSSISEYQVSTLSDWIIFDSVNTVAATANNLTLPSCARSVALLSYI